MLTDSFGRTLDYLRVSVTDRCNFRCVFCMPQEGVEWKPHEAMLSFEEFLRVCRIMARLGIRKIKVTGGEPLVRRGTAAFIEKLKAIPGIEKITLTTNGFLLGEYLDEAETLAPGSLPDSVNISLDALDPERFRQLTRDAQHRPDEILPYVDRLLEKKVTVKINCVPVRGFNGEELVPLAALAKDRYIAVRFIELMPLGSASDMKPIPGKETAMLIEKAYGSLTSFTGMQGNGPAVYYSLPGFTGKIGFINAVTHGFCESCNRLRLTSEGFLKLCLSHDLGLDVRALLRTGADDSEIERAITGIAAIKPQFHSLSGVYGAGPANIKNKHSGGMSTIGG